MTYRDLFYKATRLVTKGEITLGEYEEMTKPLDREIEQEPIDYKTQYESFSKKAEIVISQLRADRDRLADFLEKIRTEIEQEPYISKMEVLDILDKYKVESEE